LLNRDDHAFAGNFLKFFLVNIVSLAANLAGLASLVELLSIHPPIAQLATIGITLVMNFLGNKFWIFRTSLG